MNWLKSNAVMLLVLVVICVAAYFIWKKVEENNEKDKAPGNTGIAGGIANVTTDAAGNTVVDGVVLESPL